MVGSTLGYQLLHLIPDQDRPNLLIPFLVLYLAMVILELEPGWSIALLMIFSITAGAILRWSGADPTNRLTWVLFLSLGAAAAACSALLGPWFRKVHGGLQIGMLIYTLGWMFLIFRDSPTAYWGIWIGSGLLLYTLISIGILQQGADLKPRENLVPHASRLFVILINTFWLASLIT